MENVHFIILATIIPATFILWDAFISLINKGVKHESKLSVVIRLFIAIIIFYFILQSFGENINPIYITAILFLLSLLFLFKQRNIDNYTLEKLDAEQCEEILEYMLQEKRISFEKRYEKEEQWTRYDKKVIYKLSEEKGRIVFIYNGEKKYPSIRMKGYHLEDRFILHELLPNLRTIQKKQRLHLYLFYQLTISLGLIIIGILPNIKLFL